MLLLMFLLSPTAIFRGASPRHNSYIRADAFPTDKTCPPLSFAYIPSDNLCRDCPLVCFSEDVQVA